MNIAEREREKKRTRRKKETRRKTDVLSSIHLSSNEQCVIISVFFIIIIVFVEERLFHGSGIAKKFVSSCLTFLT
jgi:hypothetical protein